MTLSISKSRGILGILDSQAQTLGTKCSPMGKAVFFGGDFCVLSPGFLKNGYLQTGCLWLLQVAGRTRRVANQKRQAERAPNPRVVALVVSLGRVSLEREDGCWFQVMVDPLQLKGMFFFSHLPETH